MKYLVQTSSMFLLKYFDCKVPEEITMDDLVVVLSKLHHDKQLDIYSFLDNGGIVSPELISDLSCLERQGLILSTHRSEPRYRLSSLAKYFCMLIETPDSLKEVDLTCAKSSSVEKYNTESALQSH